MFSCFQCWLALGLSCAHALGQAPAATPQETNRASAATQATPPPLPKGVDLFRQILAMPPAEREKYFATRTPQQRQIIETKLREYEALDAKAREARLRSLQLRVQLRQLMRLPSSNRLERLAASPDADQQFLRERLQQWDLLSPAQQRELLEVERVIGSSRLGTNLQARGPSVPSPSLRQSDFERDIARWNALPDAKRQVLVEHFRQFFDEMGSREKTRALNALTEAERHRMELTLQAFQKLPREQRDRCLEGFQRFAGLPPEERHLFLINAAHWQTLSPEDRQTWSKLVAQAAPFRPPLPPLRKPVSKPPLPPDTAPAPTNPPQALRGGE